MAKSARPRYRLAPPLPSCPACPIPLFDSNPFIKTRVWGGRRLAERFGRLLPDPESPYGESWEISAREEADSRVAGGSLDGRTLSELWSDRGLRSLVFGEEAPEADRFPLLCKILDARDTLSIQVHPPAAVAAELGGEPKTEVWYIADAEPGAKLYVGVCEGVDEARLREALETAGPSPASTPCRSRRRTPLHPERSAPRDRGGAPHLRDPAELRHHLPRLRLEPPRHRRETARSPHRGIAALHRFQRRDPALDAPAGETLVDCEHFRLEKHRLAPGTSLDGITRGRFAILTVVEGTIEAAGHRFHEGDFFLVPPGGGVDCRASGEAEVLLTTWGGA